MNQKGLAPILIVLLIATAIGGFLLYQNQAKPTSPLQQTTQPTSTPSSSTESINSTETSNWKTYTTNVQLDIEDSIVKQLTGFRKTILTFKYPPSWEIVKNPNTGAVFSPKSNHTFIPFTLIKESAQARCCQMGQKYPFASIDIQFGIIPPGIKDFDPVYWGGGEEHQKEEKKLINGIEITKGYVSSINGYPRETLFHISPNTELYTRNLYLYDSDNVNNPTLYDKESIKEINQILSTFKFLP